MKLSVIIVNYNVRFFLEQAVRAALKALEATTGELIVVDNASTDGSREMMESRFPDVRYLYLEENLGFSKANNIGIAESQGEYILLLNPDTVVSESAFKQCVDFMDAHPDSGGLGVHMIDGEGKFLPESKRGLPTPRAAFYKMCGLSSLFPMSKKFGKYHLGFLDKEEVHEVEILSGAYMMMRKSALEKAGLLDETFFMYGEDIDLSYRIEKAGYRNYYFPKARIIHYKGESTKKGSVNYVFVFYRAMVIFAKKHFDKGQASLFSLLIEAAIYLRAGLAVVRRLFGDLWQMALDGALIYGTFWAATEVYGRFAHKHFDLPFIDTVLLSYTAIALGVLLFSSVYDQGFRFIRLFRAWLVTLLILLGFYALLPEAYRFSRAVLLFGSGGALFLGTAWRWALHLLRTEWFPIRWNASSRLVVIGDESTLEEIKEFASKQRLHYDVILGVSADKATHYPLGFVGSLDDLQKVVEDFRLDEVLFDRRVISAEKMIASMEATAEVGVRFKMCLGDPLFIVGSQEAMSADEEVPRGEIQDINTERLRRNKRSFDLLASLVMLLASPILMLFVDEKVGFFRNLFRVTIGTASWVGYDPRGKVSSLPSLKPAITYPLQNVILPGSAASQSLEKNVQYIRDHQWLSDISILAKQLHAAGGRPV